jgi:biotin carboxylase
MGDKIEARRAMAEAGLPVLPGSPEAIQSEAEGLKLAREIGFPVIVKASAGGGGRGMRIVRTEQELGHALETASQKQRQPSKMEVFTSSVTSINPDTLRSRFSLTSMESVFTWESANAQFNVDIRS